MNKTKKILALILVVVFAFTTLSTPVLAWHPDDIRYNNGGAEPEGDDGSWGDMKASPGHTNDGNTTFLTTAPTLGISYRTWVVYVLFNLGMFEQQIEEPSIAVNENDSIGESETRSLR